MRSERLATNDGNGFSNLHAAAAAQSMKGRTGVTGPMQCAHIIVACNRSRPVAAYAAQAWGKGIVNK